MSKLRVSKVVEMFNISTFGIYRDMANGTVSFEKDERGKKVIDIAELQRVYVLKEDGNSQKEEMGENGNVLFHEVGENGKPENRAVIALLEEAKGSVLNCFHLKR